MLGPVRRRIPPNVALGCGVLIATIGGASYVAIQKAQPDGRLAIIRAAAGGAQVSVVPAQTYDGSRAVIIDGDTFALGAERIRILDIDTPETRSPRCERELVAGLRAKERLANLLRSGALNIKREGQDRYGRTLARVYTDGRDVGAALISEGLALPYKAGAAARDERVKLWCK